MSPSRTPRPIGVLIITPFFSPNIGGIEVHLEAFCQFLADQGHRVYVVTYQPLTTRRLAPRKEARGEVKIERWYWFGYRLFYRLEPIPLLQTLYLIPGLLLHSLLFLLSNNRRVDVVHTHGFTASLVGRTLIPLFRKRWITSVHTTYSIPLSQNPWLGRIFCKILNRYDKILSISRRCLYELLPFGLCTSKTDTFSYWADEDRYRPIDKALAKAEVGWSGKFVVLFVGRLIRIKGADVLVRTAKEVGESVSFAFITSGVKREFIQMVGMESLPPNVEYVGPVAHDMLQIYYNAADLVAIPSQGVEGFPHVSIEALSCGTPILASRVGLLNEVITAEVGELIDPPTPEQFALRIKHYFEHPQLLLTMSKACARYGKERFSERNAFHIEQAYFDRP